MRKASVGLALSARKREGEPLRHKGGAPPPRVAQSKINLAGIRDDFQTVKARVSLAEAQSIASNPEGAGLEN